MPPCLVAKKASSDPDLMFKFCLPNRPILLESYPMDRSHVKQRQPLIESHAMVCDETLFMYVFLGPSRHNFQFSGRTGMQYSYFTSKFEGASWTRLIISIPTTWVCWCYREIKQSTNDIDTHQTGAQYLTVHVAKYSICFPCNIENITAK